MRTHADILLKIGMPKVAAALGVSRGAVQQWKNRDRIPAAFWLSLSRTFSEVSLEELEQHLARHDQAA
ncbi:MAG TPA: YdaS family helix-turn-helix protein [Caulobacteraceae bacterium]|jgi:DNA-binding transcriptional regulator YdaS (Cro superfamily)|nr:YdaS family helix-turn-helix protein [Caulobacteraceae bacterium]